MMEPGPACAAIGIHRAEMMQVTANNVMSRSPSSRLSAGFVVMPAQNILVSRKREAKQYRGEQPLQHCVH